MNLNNQDLTRPAIVLNPREAAELIKKLAESILEAHCPTFAGRSPTSTFAVAISTSTGCLPGVISFTVAERES